MTVAPLAAVWVGAAALSVLAALTVSGVRGALPPSRAAAEVAPACDSCTARHQRLTQKAVTPEDATQ